jgi:hypothetical protein
MINKQIIFNTAKQIFIITFKNLLLLSNFFYDLYIFKYFNIFNLVRMKLKLVIKFYNIFL